MNALVFRLSQAPRSFCLCPSPTRVVVNSHYVRCCCAALTERVLVVAVGVAEQASLFVVMMVGFELCRQLVHWH